jgi:DNA-binding CsgD family transcriptional regulator
MGAEWPLVGRARELTRIGEAVRGPGASGFILSGAPGTGLTRLGAESLLIAQGLGMCTARFTATRSAANFPLGVFFRLLPAGTDRRWAPGPQTLRMVRDELLTLGQGRRPVLLVDDAQSLDDASATVLLELAMAGDAFLLITVRSGQPTPDAVRVLWRDEILPRLEVEPLAAGEVAELLALACGGPVDPATVAALTARSGGNLLYLRELVLAARRAGALVCREGQWCLRGPLAPTDRLTALVEVDLTGLGEPERGLLELLACAGDLDTVALAQLAHSDIVARLDARGLLDSHRDGPRITIGLSQPIHAEVLKGRLPAHRVAGNLRAAADAVQATGSRRDEDVLRMGLWRIQGGQADGSLFASAARVAQQRGDLASAEMLARAAAEAGTGFADAILASRLASLQGRCAEAESELAELAKLAENDAQRGEIAVTRLDNFAFFLGHSEAGLQVAEEAEMAISDGAWRDELAGRRSSLLLGSRGPRAAAAVAEPLLKKASGRGLAWAGQVACYSMGRLGRFDAALDAAHRGRTAHMALDQPMDWYLHLHVNFRCDALAHAGRLDEAETLASTHYSQAVAEGSPEAQAFFGWQLAKMVGDRGDVDAAIHNGKTAVSLFRELGRPLFVREAMVALSLAYALGKRHAEAADVLASLDSLPGLAPSYYMGVDLMCTRGWVSASGGDCRTARSHFDRAVELGEEIGDLVGMATALHSIARLTRAPEAVERLADLAGSVEGKLVAARSEHAGALLIADEERLTAVATAFEDMGAMLLAAEAAAEVLAICKTKGASRRASTAARHATRLALRCAGAHTPSLHLPDPHTGITPAEQRVARLATAGQANRVIADTLSVSVRTVENHLQRMYVKLGITNRSQLLEAIAASRD